MMASIFAGFHYRFVEEKMKVSVKLIEIFLDLALAVGDIGNSINRIYVVGISGLFDAYYTAFGFVTGIFFLADLIYILVHIRRRAE